MKKERSIRRFLSSKAFFLLGLIVLGFLLFALINKFVESRNITEGMESSRQEITRLEEKNSELSDLLSYLNTDAFLEHEARLKFNMQKPGESVMVVPEGDQNEKSGKEIAAATPLDELKTNPAKWWNYFFSHR